MDDTNQTKEHKPVCCFCGSRIAADEKAQQTVKFFEGLQDDNGQAMGICSFCVTLFYNQLVDKDEAHAGRTCNFCGRTFHPGSRLYRGPGGTRICDCCLAADYLKRVNQQGPFTAYEPETLVSHPSNI